jgi:hypothetical protein
VLKLVFPTPLPLTHLVAIESPLCGNLEFVEITTDRCSIVTTNAKEPRPLLDTLSGNGHSMDRWAAVFRYVAVVAPAGLVYDVSAKWRLTMANRRVAPTVSESPPCVPLLAAFWRWRGELHSR